VASVRYIPVVSALTETTWQLSKRNSWFSRRWRYCTQSRRCFTTNLPNHYRHHGTGSYYQWRNGKVAMTANWVPTRYTKLFWQLSYSRPLHLQRKQGVPKEKYGQSERKTITVNLRARLKAWLRRELTHMLHFLLANYPSSHSTSLSLKHPWSALLLVYLSKCLIFSIKMITPVSVNALNYEHL
jgi:hypothetical protein